VGASDLRSIELKFNNGIARIETLKGNQKKNLYINPDGESDLTMLYIDQSGRKCEKLIDVYFEHNYWGVISITVNPNCDVGYVSAIKARLL